MNCFESRSIIRAFNILRVYRHLQQHHAQGIHKHTNERTDGWTEELTNGPTDRTYGQTEGNLKQKRNHLLL